MYVVWCVVVSILQASFFKGPASLSWWTIAPKPSFGKTNMNAIATSMAARLDGVIANLLGQKTRTCGYSRKALSTPIEADSFELLAASA